MSDVEVANCTKRYRETTVLRGVSFEVGRGELLSILGPSGCGKTTTLRIIAGFVPPDGGDVFIRGKNVTRLPAHLRNIGMVFQNYALWPHMTVFENVAFGLRLRKMRADAIDRQVTASLSRVRLEGKARRYPTQLSGGEQQRVALARALAIDPDVLLLDEPLSNLDRQLREEMRVELKTLQRTLGLTSLYVTHDQEEALSVSDRIVVMGKGEIQQIGTPQEIYEHPANRFVAGFIGYTNFLECVVVSVKGKDAVVRLLSGATLGARSPDHIAVGARAMVMIRPEQIRLSAHPPESATGQILTGRLQQIIYEGASLRHAFHLTGREEELLFAHGAPDQPHPQPGDLVYVEVQRASLIAA
jgi:spermidine/putrescine ABC transporter ATP-binding subunit